jgi:hypothetical protein
MKNIRIYALVWAILIVMLAIIGYLISLFAAPLMAWLNSV